MDRVRDTAKMIAGMAPELSKNSYVFATLSAAQADLAEQAIATIAEDEGLSVILPLDAAKRAGFDCSLSMRRITLRVHSALDGVGLTAAVATVLAEADIPCNMVAGNHHDHAFVPTEMAEMAVARLSELATQAAQ